MLPCFFMFDSVRALLTVKILQSYHDMKCFPRLSLSLAPRVGFCGPLSSSTILVGCFLSIFFLCLPFFFSLLFFLAPSTWLVSQQGMKVREKNGAKRTLGKDRKLLLVYPSWVKEKNVPMVSCFLGSLVSIMEASLAVKTGWKYHVLGVGV